MIFAIPIGDRALKMSPTLSNHLALAERLDAAVRRTPARDCVCRSSEMQSPRRIVLSFQNTGAKTCIQIASNRTVPQKQEVTSATIPGTATPIPFHMPFHTRRPQGENRRERESHHINRMLARSIVGSNARLPERKRRSLSECIQKP